jgi:PAT family beta-lactamase induction signal transducer AmpG
MISSRVREKISHLFNRRTCAVLLLAVSSGLPLPLCGATLQAWYTTAGVDIHTIGLLSLVGLPYLYKFLWAPLLDKYPLSRLGKRRSWIIVMQACLLLTLVLMAFLNPVSNPYLLASTALIFAFFSATQDIGIDAYRTDVLKTPERGMGATFNTVGYRFALIISGAIAMILAEKIGWRLTYLFMAGIFLVEILVTLTSPKPSDEVETEYSWKEVIAGPLRELWSRKYIMLILLLIVFYKFADALALALNTTFLLRGVGFSLIEVGSIGKLVGLIAALLGSLAGGVLLQWLSLYRALLYFGILQLLSNLMFMWLAIAGKKLILMGFAVAAENFCGGLSTVAFVAFLMGLCDKRFTATQFAILSAASAVSRVCIGPLAAVMVSHLGWAMFYFVSFLLGWPIFALLVFFKYRIDFTADKIQAFARST